jgi:hypothetical protein
LTHHEHRNGGNSAAPEEIHLPGPTLLPLFTAGGITLALLGLIWSWWFVAVGGLVTLIAVARWISAVRSDIQSLPAGRR